MERETVGVSITVESLNRNISAVQEEISKKTTEIAEIYKEIKPGNDSPEMIDSVISRVALLGEERKGLLAQISEMEMNFISSRRK